MASVNEPCGSVVDYLLLKVAARCNIACTYCYWFRDPSVLSKPKMMSEATFSVLLARLERHVARYSLVTFSILLHGGEPLLCPKRRLSSFLTGLEDVTARTGCVFQIRITTNGLLVDPEWVAIFNRFRIGVTISVDGPREMHDSSRVDFQGQGTFDRVIGAIAAMRNGGIEPGVIAVCHPEASPDGLVSLFADELGLDGFDVLIPDATHRDRPESILPYYSRLADIWFETLAARGIRVRIIDNILLGLFGGFSESESIGYGPIRRLTVLSDGSMETLDVLRIVQPGFTASSLNVLTNEIQDIEQDPLWREVLDASLRLPEQCSQCVYKLACGGGHIATRWSDERRFDNPSVYCSDLQGIFRHVWSRVGPELVLAPVERGQAAGGGAHAGA